MITASCPNCPFQGEYRTDGLARRALRQHSCDWQRHLAAQRARGAGRRAAIDRTPQPCHHKNTHQHGTRVCYVQDRCRCPACSAANSAAENRRYRLKAYGRYQPYVDATPAREHLRELMAQGMGPKRVSDVSGVAHGVISAVIYGKFRGKGKPAGPQKRIRPDIAARILAVQFEPAGCVLAAPEETELARRQARALVALGWSMSSLGRRIGVQPGNFCKIISSGRPLQWTTVRKIRQLYARLSMSLPPATNQRERISVNRSKRYAREHGWRPPLDLEAELDGQDQDCPLIDEQAIWRRLHGDKTVRLSKAEKLEAVRQWQASGRPLNELERMTHWNVFRYLRDDLEVAS